MHAFVTVPFSTAPFKLQKINSTIYYHPESQKFYKNALLDPLTAFVREDLVTRQNIVFTEYDPSFLVLQYFDQNSQISVSLIPKHLKLELFEQFGDFDSEKTKIKRNMSKIMDFLEERALRVVNLVHQKNYYREDMIRLSGTQNLQEKKEIPHVIVQILKKDIPQSFLTELVLSRFKKQIIKRPIVLDTYQQFPREEKKKKPTPKQKKEPQMPVNQKSLLGFLKK